MVTLDRHALMLPFRWEKPQIIFVNSMSDLFHDGVPVEFIMEVFGVIAATRRHTYQILTKRADRLAGLSPELPWPSNLWMGVSVEDADYVWRIDRLRQTGARIKFLSIEPLIAPVGYLDLTGIEWVIVGGESGPRARPMDPDWVRSVRDQCVAAGVPFFFKQWGGRNKKRAGRILDGRSWDEYPE